jgi:hypothetical protein
MLDASAVYNALVIITAKLIRLVVATSVVWSTWHLLNYLAG